MVSRAEKYLCLFFAVASISAAPAIQVRLTSGKVVKGTKVSENFNFLIVDVDGSNISLLKSMIDTIYDADVPPPPASKEKEDSSKVSTLSNSPKAIAKPPMAKPVPTKAPKKGAPPIRRKTDLVDLWDSTGTLKNLDLSFQELDNLSPRIGLFKKLTHLDLKGNNLSTLPAQIGDLGRLKDLDLRYNRISQLPPQIMNLVGLQHLWLTGNRLSNDQLHELEELLPYTNVIYSKKPPQKARILQREQLSAREKQLSLSLWEGCSHGVVQSCTELAKLYNRYMDWERELIAAEDGCRMEMRDTSSAALACCERAARIRESTVKDLAESIEYYRYLCNTNSRFSPSACSKIRRNGK